jgi:hypothetical protein
MPTSIAPAVDVRTSPQDVPSVPSWFAEVVVLARHLAQRNLLDTICHQVRLSRGRAGHYDVIDFFAILLGYACSGEPTLETFFERLVPFAAPFMALFGRDQLPHRSTLSRFLADIDLECLAALRHLFQDELHQHGFSDDLMGGLIDRQGHRLIVFDVDGTRQAARQRALVTSTEVPAPQRRMQPVCAPGYTGRKRGEVVRTRTTILQAHTQEWLGTFSGAGNGDYQAELDAACRVTVAYLASKGMSPSQAVMRLDGLYGTTAFLVRLHQYKLGFLTRGRMYQLLDHATVQARLQQPSDGVVTHPETQVRREVFDAGFITDWLEDQPEQLVRYRVIVTRRAAPTDQTPSTVGKRLDDYVYELFLTSHPAACLSATMIVELYQHRGSFEQVLSDEDQEQDPDRWCSLTGYGQEFWQVVSQWVWNMRLEVGAVVQEQPLRWTRWQETQPDAAASPSLLVTAVMSSDAPHTEELLASYGPLELAQPWAKARQRFSAQDFRVLDNDTLECPAGKLLRVRERRKLESGDLRILYTARSVDCRACLLAAQCVGRGSSGEQPRRVSGVRKLVGWQMHAAPSVEHDQAPAGAETSVDEPKGCEVRWCDVGGRHLRRDWVTRLRRQRVTIMPPAMSRAPVASVAEPRLWTRAERAHRRLKWAQRLVRNALPEGSPRYGVILCGIPAHLAAYLGLPSAPAG